MAKKILVVGLNPVWQRIIFLPQLELGKINRASDVIHVASGKGLNYSKVLKYLGTEPILAGFAGGDRGVKFIKGVNKLEIESIYIQTENTTRSCTTLISENPHNVTEIIDPSPQISEAEASSLLEKIQEIADDCGAIVLSGTHPNGMPQKIYKEILACFKDKLSVIDAYMDIKAVLESNPKMLKVNQSELFTITGKNNVDQAAAICFNQHKIEYLGVTNGPDDAFFYTKKQKYTYKLPNITVLNSTGAGDAVGAAMVYKHFIEQEDIDTSFLFGLACGLACCETNLPSEFDLVRANEMISKIEWTMSSWKK